MTPWAPGAPGVLGDDIFVISDHENHIGLEKLLPKLIIFNTYLLEDALVKMHFPIRKMGEMWVVDPIRKCIF